MQIETLEGRQLLSATLNSATGELAVTGTAGNDGVIIARVSKTQFAVTERSVAANHKVAVSHKTFNLADLKSITVNTLAGNDQIVIGPGITAPATVDGGDGN